MKASYYAANRSEMLGHIPPKAKRILEVGCGFGNFGKLLKEQDPIRVVYGLELNPDAGLEAKKHLDQVIIGDASQHLSQFPEKSFDCIVFNDVLEHLPNPEAVLETCRKLLTPSGSLVLSLPNVRYIKNLFNLIVKRDWQYEDDGILDRTHLRFFTKKSILRMFQELNFTITTCVGIHPTRVPLFFLLNVLSFGLFGDTKYMNYVVVAFTKQSNKESA